MHESRYGSKAYVLSRSEDNKTTPPPYKYGDLINEDYGPSMLGAIWTTWSIAVIFVALRFWARSRVVNGLGASDWCILLSLIVAAAMSSSLTLEIRAGLGKHAWNVDVIGNYVPLMVGFWASVLFYFLSLALTKISICLLYLTIFTVESARRATYAVLAIVCVTSAYTVLVIFTACIPLEDYWNPNKPWNDKTPSNCHDTQWYWSCTGLTIITDFLIFLLPIPIVGPLKLPRRQKLFVIGIFAVGFIVCIISLVRVFYLHGSQEIKVEDMTFSTGKLTYWTALEVHIAIAVACVMTLKPLIVRFFPGFLDPRANNDNSPEPGATGAPTAASSEPPLTVGRRPCRIQRLSWIEVRDAGGEQQQQQQQQQRGPGPTTTTMMTAMGDVLLREIPVSGRERYKQFLHPFPAAGGRTSSEMDSKTATTTTRTTTNYNSTVTNSAADSINANSVTTSVSMSCCREEEEDLSSTADLKGFVHAHTVYSHTSDDVSVRTGTGTGTGDLGPEQAVRSM